jgi:type I restriction enzyme S subunit
VKGAWPTKVLGDVCDILDYRRKPITKRDRESGEFPYYGATGVLDHVSGYLFDEPLVLVGEDGAKWASGDSTAFPVSGKVWVNNHAHVIRPHKTELIDNWLIHFLNHSDLTQFVSGLTVPKLNQGTLREIPIPVPPLPEQERILAILDKAFEGIATVKANAEKNLHNARAIFESQLEAVFRQRGPGWAEKRLGSLFEIGSSKRIYEKDWTTSGVPFYGGRELVKLAKHGTVVSNVYISNEKYTEYAGKYDMPKKGDILITARGTIGVGFVVQDDEKFYYKDGNVISLRPIAPLNPFFFLYSFQCMHSTDQFGGLAGATVRHLSLEKAKELSLYVPSTETQNLVVARTGLIKNESKRLERVYERKLAALDALKKSLLHRAFAGELTANKTAELVEAVA